MCVFKLQDLSDNQIEAAGALAVTGMLESNSTLTHLSLRGRSSLYSQSVSVDQFFSLQSD